MTDTDFNLKRTTEDFKRDYFEKHWYVNHPEISFFSDVSKLLNTLGLNRDWFSSSTLPEDKESLSNVEIIILRNYKFRKTIERIDLLTYKNKELKEKKKNLKSSDVESFSRISLNIEENQIELEELYKTVPKYRKNHRPPKYDYNTLLLEIHELVDKKRGEDKSQKIWKKISDIIKYLLFTYCVQVEDFIDKIPSNLEEYLVFDEEKLTEEKIKRAVKDLKRKEKIDIFGGVINYL